jgi:hypothetical protein
MTPDQPACLHCERTSQQVPLIALRYQGADLWICPEHLPILIHQPQKLANKLPNMALAGPPSSHTGH